MNTWNRKLLSAMLCLAMLAGMLFVGVQPIRAEEAGNLTVIVNNGSAEQAYSYENNILTVKDGADITISGTTTTDHIVVENGVTDVKITLNNVNITHTDGGSVGYTDTTDDNAGTCALSLGENASLSLIIAGDNTLQSGAGRAGIFVPEGAALTIDGAGSLTVSGGDKAAGIGGDLWHNAGSIIIEGGTITANGGTDSAGIGGAHANDGNINGQTRQYGGFESITINGGTVTAISTGNGAAIGTGCWSTQAGRITITGGIINAIATSGNQSYNAAIGQGFHSDFTTGVVSISISNSTITATNVSGAQISGSVNASITNSLVGQGRGNVGNYDIYGSYTFSNDFSLAEGQSLTIDSEDILNLGDHTLTNQGTIVNYGTVTGNGKIANNGYIYNAGTISEDIVSGNAPISITDGSYQYLDASGTEQTSPSNTEDITSVTTSLGVSESTDEQWYIVLGNVSFEGNLAVNGDVHLILADGSSLNANGGIRVSPNNSLTVYGQHQGTGQLTAAAGVGSRAGIGGPWSDMSCGSITINGGIVTATGGENAAGIGGGASGSGGSVTINGGIVTANGGRGAAGIGGGRNANGGNVLITGGTVVATGGESYYSGQGGDGIGMGQDSSENHNAGTFSTGENGNAVIIATAGLWRNAIGDTSGMENWRGVIFQQGSDENTMTGEIYGTAVTPSADFTVPSNATLTIDSGQTLTIPEGVTMTNNGTIKGAGSIVVYGTLAGTGTITGVNTTLHVTGVSLNQETLSMTVSDTAQLTATVQPADAYNQAVSWSSSNTVVASVDSNGLVTAVAPGTAIITVTTEDGGFSAQCTVSVQDVKPPTDPEEPPYIPPITPEAPSGPSTGESDGWENIADEITAADDGDSITIDMNSETKVPADIFEEAAGKDVTISFDMGDGVIWEINGQDIPEDTGLSDLDLGVSMNTNGIPVDVINNITGEATSVQITLAHDGDFGFALTLTAPLGEENHGYWANLYHYDEDAERLDFETAALIEDDGSARLQLTHASQYAIVIDDHSHEPAPSTPVSDIFTDVAADAWYKDVVQYAYDNGLMTGTSATTFAPDTTTSRAMIVSILHRLEGAPAADNAGFTDVAEDDWYAEPVNWAASIGIVGGFGDGSFQPNDPLTREQMASILYRYAEYKGLDTTARADLTGYADADQIGDWAYDVMSWANEEGLLNGVTDDQLQPQGTATRAQVAAMLQRFIENVL